MRKILLGTMVFGIVLAGFSCTAFAETVCFQCHKKEAFSGKSVHKPVAEDRCGKCHNPHVAKYEGMLQEKGAALCYDCHRKAKKEYARGVVHKPVQTGDCGACHAPHASGQKALLRKPLARICFTCHAQEEKKYQVSHKPFAAGNCTACHQPHQSGQSQLLKSGDDTLCLNCHKAPDAMGGHKGFPGKVRGCLSCHNPHGSSKKGLIREVAHAPFAKGCKSCHDKDVRDTALCFSCHTGVMAQTMAPHNHLVVGKGNACTQCHSPHAADTKTLLKGKEGPLCKSCHLDTAQRMDVSLHKHPKVEKCSECHEPHGANRIALLKNEGNGLCSRCHETQGEFTHPVGDKVVDHRTGQTLTCLTCHDPMGTDYRYNLKQSGKKVLCVQCHRSY